MKPSDAISTFGSTLKGWLCHLLHPGMVLAFAFISNYSGLCISPGAGTGAHRSCIHLLLAGILGWLGVFLTGSDII